MKKTLLVFVVISLLSEFGMSQYVDNGYYYFRLPQAGILNEGWSLPDLNKLSDPLPTGPQFHFDPSDFVVSSSASDVLDSVQNSIQHNILFNTFKDSNGINVKVHLYNVKKIGVKREAWIKAPQNNGFYYVIYALRADSIHITGKLTKSANSSPKTVLAILSALTPAKTLVGILSATSTKADSANKSLIFNKNNLDGFDLSLKDTTIYFAAIFMKGNVELGYDYDKTLKKFMNDYNYDDSSLMYKLGKGDSMSIFPKARAVSGLPNVASFETPNWKQVIIDAKIIYDSVNKAVYIRLLDRTPSSSHNIYTDKKPIDEKMDKISFETTYPYTKPTQKGGKKQFNNVIYIEYKVDFDPKTKEVTIWNYQYNSPQTDIYIPKKDTKVEIFPKL